jgi:biotin transport system substrate-specific component
LRNLAVVFAATLVIALAAQISVPMFPVPMTMQTLAISVIGLTFGARLAGVTLLLYLAEGAAGLRVFANGGAGMALLVGPTAGFLWGFAGMAFLTGWMVENGFSRGTFRMFLAALLPAAFLYLPGVLGLWAVTPLDLSGAFNAGALPFLAADVVKSILAVMIVTGGWTLLKKKNRPKS